MAPLIVLTIVAIALLVYGPQLWVKIVLSRHSGQRDYFPGTASELARHLLDANGLTDVAVERTNRGDHYDPQAKAVRLGLENHGSRSLTAIVTAAHEVGHALQDRDGYPPLRLRSRLVGLLPAVTKISNVAFGVSLFLSIATFSPLLVLLTGLAMIATLGAGLAVHLVTLPVEYNASFGRALPILDRDGYVPPGDVPAARRILHACALTYVASALAGLLNILRLFRRI
ncbi:unnamed protein product [Discosporangium mesarthrocarpum]